MKHVKILLMALLLLLPAWSFAKAPVQASQIIAQINQGKAVNYSDTEIVGKLDFTSIKDTQLDERHGGRKGFFGSSTRSYWSHVRVPLTFSNCVFRGDVLAYVHDDDEDKTMNVIFHEQAEFQGCEFQGKSHFKYVAFKGPANFQNSTYRSEALFKYTKFSTGVDFSGSSFQGDANFKYVKFPGAAAFNNATFKREANFKYAEFPDAAGFEKSVFHDEANFKYAEFRGAAIFMNAAFQSQANFKYAKFSQSPDFAGTAFEDDINFKYTKVRGRSFTHDLLLKKK